MVEGEPFLKRAMVLEKRRTTRRSTMRSNLCRGFGRPEEKTSGYFLSACTRAIWIESFLFCLLPPLRRLVVFHPSTSFASSRPPSNDQTPLNTIASNECTRYVANSMIDLGAALSPPRPQQIHLMLRSPWRGPDRSQKEPPMGSSGIFDLLLFTREIIGGHEHGWPETHWYG